LRFGSRTQLRSTGARTGALVRLVVGLSAATLLAGLPAESQAQADHLKCYRLRARKSQWTVDTGTTGTPFTLTPFAPPFTPEAGCRLVPQRNPRPRKLCTAVGKSPQQAPLGGPLSFDYACYTIKCPKSSNVDLPLTTQFGNGTLNLWGNTVFR